MSILDKLMALSQLAGRSGQLVELIRAKVGEETEPPPSAVPVTPAQNEAAELRLLTAGEVADLLGVQEATVYSWTYQRRIPFVKLGRNLLRFRLADLERFIAKRVQSPLRALGLRRGGESDAA